MRSVESFVARIVEDLEKKSEERRQVIVRRKVSTIISQCGYSCRSHRLLAELDRAIEEAQSFVDPDVTDTGLGLPTWIRTDGSHVVCELKVGDPTDRSVSQLLKYVDAADAIQVQTW
jgi:hypothetical protein